jgi:hypothetical protein
LNSTNIKQEQEWYDVQLGFHPDSPASWFNRWRIVLQKVLIRVIRVSAKDHGRKRSYSSRNLVKLVLMETATPGYLELDGSLESLTAIPLQNIPLDAWVNSLREHPEMCEQYDFVLTDMPQSPPDDTAPEKHDQINLEVEPTEAELENIKEIGQDTQAQMEAVLEQEIHENTAPVYPH